MKKWLLLVLFLVGFSWAITTFQGLATQGQYDSLIFDFSESLSTAEIESKVQSLSETFQTDLNYNSEFSQKDHVFIAKGDAQLLKSIKKSGISEFTEFIEPNYTYQTSVIPNDPDYDKQWNLKSIQMEKAWGAGQPRSRYDCRRYRYWHCTCSRFKADTASAWV